MTRHALERRCPTRPARIVIEGLCLAGKSTLAAALAHRLGAVVVPDYGQMAQLPTWPPTDNAAARAALAYFAELEQRREHIAAGVRTPVFDRAPLTIVAHEVAMRALGVPADPRHAVELFRDSPGPDAVLHVSVPETETVVRMRQRGPLPAHLIDPSVRSALIDYYRIALAHLSPARLLKLDGAKPTTRLRDEAIDFLSTLPTGPPPPWKLPDSLPTVRTRAS